MLSLVDTGTSCWARGRSQTDNKVLLSIVNVPALTFVLRSSLQEEDVHLVEHGSGLPVGRKPRLLPLRSAGVR